MTATTSRGRLAGRRILITGGASGIGLATAELFVAEGAKVALLDRDRDAGALAAKRLGAFFYCADVASEKEVMACVNQAADALRGIDGLVNSAGISVYQPLASTDVATWQRTFDVNLTGAMLVAREALPYLKKSAGSTIVNVASGIGLRPFADRGAYAASKAGLIGWTRVLAQELAPDIRVNATCPGSTDTPLMQAQLAADGAPTDAVPNLALRRRGKAVEQAQAILFLTGPESTFVTGVALAVDGGRTFH
jgi:NAD(P)-dependent dehydrogenase (short-subunit alcohol dehydrogenase family)